MIVDLDIKTNKMQFFPINGNEEYALEVFLNSLKDHNINVTDFFSIRYDLMPDYENMLNE